MRINVSISILRNELYVYHGEDYLFQVNGEGEVDFTKMTETEGLKYVRENYNDVLERLAS